MGIALFLLILVLFLPEPSSGCGIWPCDPNYCDESEPCPEVCACKEFVCRRW